MDRSRIAREMRKLAEELEAHAPAVARELNEIHEAPRLTIVRAPIQERLFQELMWIINMGEEERRRMFRNGRVDLAQLKIAMREVFVMIEKMPEGWD